MKETRILAVILGHFTCLLCLSSATAVEDPCTLYKPRDIENARANASRYAWAEEIVERWKRRVEFAMQKDLDFFEQLIPELTPGSRYGQSCPHCVGRKSLMGHGNFSWSVTKPNQLTCRDCGTVYPNEDYPETGVLKCPRMGQTFTYYETPEERAHPAERAKYALKWGTDPRMTTFSGQIRYHKAAWAWTRSLTLAKLYALTEEIDYAERAAWILNRFARVYPNYLFHSYDGSIADWPPAKVAANMGKHEQAGGRRGGVFAPDVVRHAYGLHQHEDYSTLHNGFWGAGRLRVHGKGSDAWPLFQMTVTYDLIKDAQYPDGRPLLDAAQKERIVDDLVLAGCRDMEHWRSLSNKGVAVFILSAAVGQLLEQPERIRRAWAGFNEMVDARYHFDGFYGESPAYAAHNFGNVQELPDVLYGYSDPPDYQPEEGKRLDDLNPFAAGHFHRALKSMMRMLAPGRCLPTIGDTKYGTRMSPRFAEVLACRLGGQYASLLETVWGATLPEKGTEYSLWYRSPHLRAEGEAELPLRSEWFPGWHVAVLRGGQGDTKNALYVNGNENQWTLRTGHRHRDVLGISYYSHGEELVSDRGYFSGSGYRLADGRSGQRWMKSTLSHNLVVVDEQDQSSRDCGSNLELFGVAPGVEVVQASGVNVYSQCDAYRRTTALIRTPGGGTYAVDLFRVSGGKTHQYSFHCNGELVRPRRAELDSCQVQLAPNWGKWLENPLAMASTGPRLFTWQSGEMNLDLRLLNNQDRIIIADAPGWRRARPAELKKPPIQQVLAEHRCDVGDDEVLATQYAAVIVPYAAGESPVIAVEQLKNDAASGVVALKVQLENRTDYIVSSEDQQRRQLGPVTTDGDFAFVSEDQHGKAVHGYLLSGTELTSGELEIRQPAARTTLPVRDVSGRTFHLAEPVPEGTSLGGSYLLANQPPATYTSENGPRPRTGFEIESTTADSITVRDYPAVESDQVTILHASWLRREQQ